MISQIRKDIASRRAQQDERAKIISRIIADQEKIDGDGTFTIHSSSMSRSQSQFNNTSSFVSSFACSYVETKEQKPKQKRSKTVKQGTIYKHPEVTNGHILSTGLDLGNHIQSLNQNELYSYH